jgi:subtilisin family serine protease
MKKLLLCLSVLLNISSLAILPNDPAIHWDSNTRLPLSSNPSTYFRDEYCWYFNNEHINTHVYNSLNQVQLQFDEPIGDSNIHVQEAWDIIREVTNTIIAVIDYGFDLYHEDLINNTYLPGIYFDAFGNANQDLSDGSGHGTMVMSVLAANGNNNIGTCGILWKAKILPIKITTRGYQWALAINYAIDNGADIINISDSTDGKPETLAALQRARDNGIIVVCAAPNSNVNLDTTIDYPSAWNLDNVIIVSSSTRAEVPYSAAAYGANSVDLFAPGRLIVACWPGNSYRYTSGVSFATSIVSGSCALIKELYPYLTYQQIIYQLLSSVDQYPSYYNKCISGGRLNVYKSILPLFIPEDQIIRPQLMKEDENNTYNE